MQPKLYDRIKLHICMHSVHIKTSLTLCNTHCLTVHTNTLTMKTGKGFADGP